MKAIDLGHKSDYGNTPCDCAEGSKIDKDKGPKVSYPCLYIHDAPEDMLGIPKEGKAVITFRRKSRTEGENYDGDESNSVEIEVQSFEPVEEKDSAPTDAETALKGYFAKK